VLKFGKRTQHGKPRGVVRDDQPDARMLVSAVRREPDDISRWSRDFRPGPAGCCLLRARAGGQSAGGGKSYAASLATWAQAGCSTKCILRAQHRTLRRERRGSRRQTRLGHRRSRSRRMLAHPPAKLTTARSVPLHRSRRKTAIRAASSYSVRVAQSTICAVRLQRQPDMSRGPRALARRGRPWQ
jgi:hypothetical protein